MVTAGFAGAGLASAGLTAAGFAAAGFGLVRRLGGGGFFTPSQSPSWLLIAVPAPSTADFTSLCAVAGEAMPVSATIPARHAT